MSEQGYRPEFLAALDLLARASALMVAEGHAPPILVGGAVVEFDTMSAVTTGDLDVVAADQAALGRALEAVGFSREDRGSAGGTIPICRSPWIACPAAITTGAATRHAYGRSN